MVERYGLTLVQILPLAALYGVGSESNTLFVVLTSMPDQQTISIDLSKSWTTSNVSPVITNKSSSVPLARRADMWYDQKADFVYSMGGWHYNKSGPLYLEPDAVELWGFKPSSGGSVDWQLQPWSSDPLKNRVTANVFGSMTATSPKGHYSLGGSTFHDPRVQFTGEDPIRELDTFHSSPNETWSSTIMPDNTFLYGEAQYIDTYGAEGVIIFFGGLGNTIKDLTTVLVYDIHTQVFYRQNTTNAPLNRSFFCSVGAKSENNGSYEM
jgi:hypothetical protein